ncbi:Carrier protein YMC2, mitochondrial [Hondaea fermentalgiana]|uniref:Carrier protein YMC2, mitochondrial n=1 Tax=Hondaea fermentalgiana TaxID=2315210 RepID=A0A2R5GWR7_9STRA|nr:Carrier protein YMC2, mitochondrial [Hondaea fermentalgiana]|eukprot:GBG33113.1 Carrier protein YMC2, mitochondrial [Hondaea fermentalgiana]
MMRRYRGPLDCLQQTVRHEGVSALYKGLSGPLMAQAVYKAVMFGGFGYASRQLDLATYREAGAHDQVLARAFLCGSFAGTLNAFVVCPVELVRTRLMVQQEWSPSGQRGGVVYRGAWDCIRQTVTTEAGGPAALWRGLTSTILRDGPGVGMWFGSFEATKLILTKSLEWDPVSNATLLTSGAMGGVGFWLVALPFDTIKSNIQTAHRAEDASIAAVVRRLGLRGLYTGLSVSLVRGVPGAGITFFAQKRALDFFTQLSA